MSSSIGSDAYSHPDPLVRPTSGNAMQSQNAQQRAIPRPSCGMPFRTLPGGVSFYGDRKSKRGSSSVRFPFQVSLRQVEGDLVAVIYPGTISGVMPTIDGTPLDDGTPPELEISSSGTHRIYVKCEATLDTSAEGYVYSYTGLSVSIDSASVVPADILTSAWHRHIATVVDGALTGQMVQNSLELTLRDLGAGAGTAASIFSIAG